MTNSTSLWFTAYKKLSANNRTISIDGRFTEVTTHHHKFDSEGPLFLQGSQTVSLSSVVTNAKERDKNLINHLFTSTNSLIDMHIQVEQKEQKLNKIRPSQWSWQGVISLRALKTIEIPVHLKIIRLENKFRKWLKITSIDPITIKPSELGLPFDSFLKTVGMPLIPDLIKVEWSSTAVEEERIKSPRVVIAGAGIAGLSAAHTLANNGLEVVVLERNPECGGKLSSYIDESLGHTIEHGIHGFFPTYKNLFSLIKEAQISDDIYVKTKSTALSGIDGMADTLLSKAYWPTPFFLLQMIPKSVMRIRDYLSTLLFFGKVVATQKQEVQTTDFTTFRDLMTRYGVSKRMSERLLIPYVRNLSYATGEEVSALAASNALNYYVLENPDDIKAKWLDAGPNELVVNPWVKHISQNGIKFKTNTEINTTLFKDGKFIGFSTKTVIDINDLPAHDKIWIEQVGHHPVGLRWQAKEKSLTALDARCTHQGCPLRTMGKNGNDGFGCDCHGGLFDSNGKVTKAPPTRNLSKLPLQKHSNGNSTIWTLDPSSNSRDKNAVYNGDFGILCLDNHACSKTLGPNIPASMEPIRQLRTTDVAVLRMWLNISEWQGADSGVFSSTDILDNFFVLNRFQSEFKILKDELVIEAHIGEAERFANLTDADILQEAWKNLRKNFKFIPENCLNLDKTRVLRHLNAFSLFSPGDRIRQPSVTEPDRSNLMLAGDWVASKERSWFMERATMTGIEAANEILKTMGLPQRPILTKDRRPIVLEIISFPWVATSKLTRVFRKILKLDS